MEFIEKFMGGNPIEIEIQDGMKFPFNVCLDYDLNNYLVPFYWE